MQLVGKRVRCPRCEQLSIVEMPAPSEPSETSLPPDPAIMPPLNTDEQETIDSTPDNAGLFIDPVDELQPPNDADSVASPMHDDPQATVEMDQQFESDPYAEPFEDEVLVDLIPLEDQPGSASSSRDQSRWRGGPRSYVPPKPVAGGPPISATPISQEEEVDDEPPPRAFKMKKSVPQEADMDMTPMVDVTFLLLIFFMVTASFTMQKSLSIPKPESDKPSTQAKSVEDFEENPDFIVVRVDSLNTFFVSAAHWDDEVEAPTEQELLVKLRQAREGSGGAVPTKMLVIASGEALHERVVMAIDAGNDVGMEEVQLLSVEDDDE